MRASYAQGTLLDLLRDLVKIDTQNPDFSGFAGSEGLPPLPTPLESFGGARARKPWIFSISYLSKYAIKKSRRAFALQATRARARGFYPSSTLVLP